MSKHIPLGDFRISRVCGCEERSGIVCAKCSEPCISCDQRLNEHFWLGPEEINRLNGMSFTICRKATESDYSFVWIDEDNWCSTNFMREIST